MPKFNRRLAVIALSLALGVPAAVRAEDLMQVYREAQQYDPVLASARASWSATQERVPQARAGLLPTVGLAGTANHNDGRVTIKGDQRSVTANSYQNWNYSISASQPLFRMQNMIVVDQANQQVAQADYILGLAQQDLILRVTVAYFDILLAEFTVELNEAQKAAVSEQLAQAKRNFEVGVATITDTNEAQAKYDSIIAQEIAARNDLENKRTAMRAIIGRFPKDLKKLGASFTPVAADTERTRILGRARARREPLGARRAVQLRRRRPRGRPRPRRALSDRRPGRQLRQRRRHRLARQRLRHQQSLGQHRTRAQRADLPGAAPSIRASARRSRSRRRFRQDLEIARRNALYNAQTGFSGVNSAVALVKAFEQTVISTQVALESNRLGQEVGVRTNLDVLNVQQLVFSARRDLAQAYFNYLTATLRLKAAAGALTEADLEELNRRLGG